MIARKGTQRTVVPPPQVAEQGAGLGEIGEREWRTPATEGEHAVAWAGDRVAGSHLWRGRAGSAASTRGSYDSGGAVLGMVKETRRDRDCVRAIPCRTWHCKGLEVHEK